MNLVTQWFHGFKLKMLILVMVPVLVIISLIALTVSVSKDVAKSAAQVTEVRVPSLQGLQMMEDGRTTVRILYFDFFSNLNKMEASDLRNKITSALKIYREGWELYAPLEQTKEEAQEWEKFVPLAKAWESHVNQVLTFVDQSNLQAAKDLFAGELRNKFYDSRVPFKRIFAINYEIVEAERAQFKNVNKQSLFLSTVFGLVGIVGTLLIGFYMANQIAHSLMSVAESISSASTQVAQASHSVSQAGVSLSSAAQEQASTIEETSTSLSLITSMVQANVAVVDNSNITATKMQNLSSETTKYMENLSEAMHAILESNNRIEALVKVIEEIGNKTEVIDDIVFKTQLLSFNASVEAERAGEQGRGFAVVAQEVGNLAQMSGQAAAEISSIVKNSIKEAEQVAIGNKEKVEKGSELALETKHKMESVSRMIAEILEGTNKIAQASRDQSLGLSEINIAVENMSKATQETARNAEESSAAGVELSAQSNSLETLVQSLKAMILGSQAVVNDSHSMNSFYDGSSHHSQNRNAKTRDHFSRRAS